MNNIYENIEIFSNSISTLKQTSIDNPDVNNPTFMTEESMDVINFDKVKDFYIKDMKLKEIPCSNDALVLMDNNRMVFIEFKNGVISKGKKFNVYQKIYDSLLILTDIIGQTISFCRENVDFILVYNENKNPDEEMPCEENKIRIAKYFMEKKAKKNFIRFNLDRFEKIYLHSVRTYTEEEFQKEFIVDVIKNNVKNA